jgi:hypothetical protein
MKTVLRIGAVVGVLAGIALLATWGLAGAPAGKLVWGPPVVRSTLMSFAYKVYANPEVAEGRYFLSKAVLKNTGRGPIRDLAVSYHVPEYIPWTTAEVTNSLPAGATLVKVFYPKFTDKVPRLANKTTVTLEIKLQWREQEGGPLKEEVLRDNFTLLGVNEIQYSDLPADDIATWFDNWTLAQFLACMVTPNDPIVKEYAAAITERTGGSLAGVTKSPQDVVELMKATYEYMIATGMRYAGAKGVPEKIGDETKLVQTVRLPRDVITSNNGLCIELAILWASILDHLGCEAYVVLVPGHAFTIAMAEGQMFPIECTAITPKAVGSETYVPFEQAVKMAADNFQKQELKIPYSIRQLQAEGYSSPELPDIDIEKIKNILASRTRTAAPNTTVVQGQAPAPQWGGQAPAPAPAPPVNTGGGNAVPAGMARFDHRQGLVSFSYPQTWQMQPATAQIGNTFSVGDGMTQAGAQVYEIPGTNDPQAAMNMLVQVFGQYGAQVAVQDVRTQGDVYYFQGSTMSAMGYTQWLGVFRAVPGGVIGVTAGAPAASFEASRASFNQILGTVRFK